MLSIPLQNQFEQVLNARYLEHVGFGVCGKDLNDTAAVERFLAALPEYASNLRQYEQENNNETLAVLDTQLDRAAAGLL
jgi:hypothetical protein